MRAFQCDWFKFLFFFFSSRRRHTRYWRDWSSDVCSSDLAMGIPIIVAGQVSGVDAFAIGQMAGRQLPFMTVLVLFWLMAIMDGWRGVKETWPAVLVGGGSFAVVQFLTANFIGPELPDITSAIVSLVALTLFLKVWQPKRIFRFDTEGEGGKAAAVAAPAITSGAPLTAGA